MDQINDTIASKTERTYFVAESLQYTSFGWLALQRLEAVRTNWDELFSGYMTIK